MNIKSIFTLGLVSVAFAATSIAPAFANNNAALNQLAMQMYMQNQATAASTNLYNPLLNAGYGYGAYGAYGAGSNPWAAGAMPGVVNPAVYSPYTGYTAVRNVYVPHYVRQGVVGHRFFR